MQILKYSLLLTIVILSDTISQPRTDWITTLQAEGQSIYLWDIYQCANTDFAVCGIETLDPSHKRLFLARINPEGELLWRRSFYCMDEQSGRHEARSIIEADNEDIVVVGMLQIDRGIALAVRTNPEGESLWERTYDRTPSAFYAVIETKSGNFLCGGIEGAGDAYVLLIDEDGDPIWTSVWGIENARDAIGGIREVDGDGYYLGGILSNDAGLTKIDFNGDVVWQQRYPGNYYRGYAASLSTVNGGFCLGGGVSDTLGRRQHFRLIRTGRNGNVEWDEILDGNYLDINGTAGKMMDNGFVVAGGADNDATMVRFDAGGNFDWRMIIEQHTVYNGVLGLPDGSIAVCGSALNDGIISKFHPEVSPPVIMSFIPENKELTVLSGDRIIFIVNAIDYQNDRINYNWVINGDNFECNECQIEYFFNELTENTIKCIVSDAMPGDSVVWHVTVSDLYISHYSPDSLNLTLRRGQSVNFSLDTVRAVEGDPVLYQWRKSNDFGEIEEAGTESRATVAFLQSGNYAVEGLAYRGESSDAVTWSVDVRGVVWSFAPEDLALEVLPDSLIRFEVVPTNPEDTTLSARWFVDDEFAISDTLSLDWLFSYPVHSVHTVDLVLSDSIESDTVSWTVTVRDLGVPSPAADPPRSAALLSVSPNPFNSTLTIKYQSVESAKSAVNIYDIAGREVFSAVTAPSVTERRENAVKHGGVTAELNITWNASDVPAGVYFVRLQSGSEIATKKVVLMR